MVHGNIKPEIRIAAFDDCAFKRGQKETALIGVIFRGGDYLDGLISTKIRVDGLDSTEKLISCILNSSHYDQLRAIMLNGITVGGFNIIDIQKFWRKTSLPVIAVVRQKPDMASIKTALGNFEDRKNRLKLIQKAGRINRIEIRNSVTKGILHYQFAGIRKQTAEKIIKLSATRSIIPEPLRAADMVCSGLKPVIRYYG